jgi:hypothetical protein
VDETDRYRDEYRNLLVGCGHARDKRFEPAAYEPGKRRRQTIPEWRGTLVTLDYESPCKPDIVWDLEKVPWCPAQLPSDTYDEIHAYEVLEHLGALGEYQSFFAHFSEIWRLLKPGGYLCATVPSRESVWLLGDPGHRRAILPCTLIFLSQRAYVMQEGRTTMTDYRRVYRADFDCLHTYDDGATHQFILQAVKPSRCPAR